MSPSAGLALLPPLLLVLRLAGAVEVPGYQDKYPPLPGTERGSPESLVRNFEDVFADELLEAMDAELAAMDELARGSGALRNSKRVTFWLGRERAPRCAIERAAKVSGRQSQPPTPPSRPSVATAPLAGAGGVHVPQRGSRPRDRGG